MGLEALSFQVVHLSMCVHTCVYDCSGKSGKPEVREPHFQHESGAHQILMQVNIRCHICLSFSHSVLLVPAYPGCPGQTAVKWLLLLLF